MDPIEQTKIFFNKTRPIDTGNDRPQQPVDAYIFQKVCSLIPDGTGKVAVDLGCHWGRYVRYLADRYTRVIGVDFAPAAIASAIPHENALYYQLDLEKDGWPFGGPVDFFLAVGLFEMLRTPVEVCQKMSKVMLPGSQVLVVIPNRGHPNFWILRFMLWMQRHFFGRKDRYIYNNGANNDSLCRWMQHAGLERRVNGSFVGMPPILLARFPASLQRVFVSVDAVASSLLPGAYIWALFEKK